MEEMLCCDDSSVRWYTGDNTFRKHGPCDIRSNGTVCFSQLNPHSYNRCNGPTIIRSSGAVYYQNASGRYHRTDGPAVINADGSKEYWVNDTCVTPDVYFLKYGVL